MLVWKCNQNSQRWLLTDISRVVKAAEHLFHFNRPLALSKVCKHVCICKRINDAEQVNKQLKQFIEAADVVMSIHAIPT